MVSTQVWRQTDAERQGRHGPHTACVIEHGEQVAQEYLEAEEGSAGRRELERRYGRARVVQLVQTYLTEAANREFIRGHTTRCPRCEVAVEKSQGCNHVSGDTEGRRRLTGLDDMQAVRDAFLLQVRTVARGRPIRALFAGRDSVLLQIV